MATLPALLNRLQFVDFAACCDSVCDTLKIWWDKGAAFFKEIEPLLWRIAEVHFFKIVVFTIFVSCVVEVRNSNLYMTYV